MGTIISVLNKSGAIFCQHGMTMLVQFGLLTFLLFLADIAIRKRVKASLRYCLWCLLLVKLVLPTTLSLPTGIGQLSGVNFSVALTQVKLPEPQIQTAYAPTTSTPTQTGSEFAKPIKSQQDIAESPVSKAAESPVSAETIPLNWQGGIFIAWLFGMLVLLAEFIRRIASIKKLIAQSEPAPERLAEMVHTCQERIGVKGVVELRLSNDMVSPAVCGLLRHVIIVPTGLLEEMDRSKLAMVLMHELSHVKRADLWVNLFQTILQIFYFYNPFVWAANAYIRRVREQAVDEMVLTRLNGEAASYSNTLIDVAEKAVSRPQFRLATVSIIESKSKLKERIKIMLSKPIPKDTKIGFAGLVLIIVAAAVMLPMAKAAKTGEQTTEDSKTTMTPFTAKLDNGATVELVGICEYPPEGKKWWRPDGKELAETFSVKETGTISASGKPYAMLIKTTGSIGFSWSIEGSHGTDALTATDSQGIGTGLNGLKVFIDEHRTETTVKIIVPEGPWTKETGYNGVGIKAYTDEYGVVFSPPQQTDKGVMLVVSDNSINYDRRIIAIDDNNEVHTNSIVMGGGVAIPGRENTQLFQTTALFSNITLDKIKEYKFQTRPYHWVEFRNVSLRPGVKTDVQVLQQAPQPIVRAAEASKIETKTTGRETTNAPFTAKLDNDVTVELVSICDYPEGKPRCWRPDGSKLEKQIYVKREGPYQDGKYGFIMRVDMPDDSSFSVDKIEGVQNLYFLCAIMDSGVEINGFRTTTWKNNKPREKGYRASIMKEYDGGETTNIRVYVAAGPWNTEAKHDGRSTAAKDGFIFSKAYEADSGVNIVISGKWREGEEYRIAAIDTNDVLYATVPSRDVGRFNNIKLSQIKEFRVQTRPYQWIEFRNVSLRPGVKTDMQVLQPVSFKITSMEFQNGDSIEITDLSGPAGIIRPGDTYIVSGRYTLKSHDDAALHVYATNGETSSSQGPIIKRGEGQFTRSFTLLKKGDLHLSFYPAKGGDSFGGVYFAQKGADTGTEAVQKASAEVVDLAVEDFNISPYPEGGLYSVRASIRNNGEITSPKFRVYFYKNDPERKKPMNNGAGPIKPGDVWKEGSMPFALNEGTNELVVLLDPDNAIGEPNRTNNEAWMTVVVKDGKIVEKKVSPFIGEGHQ